MPYNLPPAWDAGYALPKNVLDEGLERRTLITKQLPRGTYDNPAVGTGGLAVPQYVKDEGYGQGTFTTKWQPSGSYVGPRVPNWLNQRPTVTRVQTLPGGGKVVSVRALGDDDAPMPPVFDDYGQRAAGVLISSVSRLPAGQRQKALRAIMDRVDKSLWSRTQTIAKRYLSQGATLQQAFPQALARALSTGIAAELIDTGLRRRAPQANSLLGLGCYGPMGLGVIRQEGPDDGPIEVPRPPSGAGTPPTGGGHSSGTPGEVAMPPAIRDLIAPTATDVIKVAGFTFHPASLTRFWAPATAPSATTSNRAAVPDSEIDSPEAMPAETIELIRSHIIAKPGEDHAVGYMGSAAWQYTEMDRTPWFWAMGIDPDTKLSRAAMVSLRNPMNPWGRVRNLYTNEDMVLHISLSKKTFGKPWDSDTNPLVLKAWLSRIPDKSLWQSIWSSLMWLPMTVAQTVIAPVAQPVVSVVTDVGGAVATVVEDGLKKLGDLACDIINTPGVAQAAGAVGATASGMPPQTGVAAGQTGAQIAQRACGAPPPPPTSPPAPPSTGPTPLTLALLGGVAAIAAVALFGTPKRSTP